MTPSTPGMTGGALEGTWTLRSWEITGQQRFEPYGADPQGLLVYVPDGWMQAMVAARERRPLSHPSPRRAPADEVADAFRSFFCYAGRWHVEDDTVVHEVHLALNPDLVGTEQRRTMRFDGGRLMLSADEPVGGALRRHVLVWERAEGVGT